MVTEKITASPEETLALARDLGEKSVPGTVFALSGDLGAGKTIFAKGIALGLHISEEITSPTFNLLETYEGRLELHHFDLYRIEGEDEFDNLFFEEYWEGDGVSVIEWAERAASRLPDETIHIAIEYIDDQRRKVSMEYPDP